MSKFDNQTAACQARSLLIKRLADRVRDARKQRGLPRRVVSELSGVSARYLAQLEAGEGNISIALLERVAQALEVPIEALVAAPALPDAEVRRVSPEALRMAELFDRAPDALRAQVAALLEAERVAGQRRGRICLIGLRGAGKTTLGRLVGDALGMPFVELSTLIERETGMPLSEVQSLYGADGMRRLEAEALERVIRQPGPMVLSVSGGLVEQEAPFARLLSRFHAVWLRASLQDHVMRVRAQGQMAPITDEAPAMAHIRSLMDARAPLYAQAQVSFDTSGHSPQDAAHALVGIIRQERFLDAG